MEVIQKVIEEYFKSWNDGFKSKDGDGIRLFMSENFVGYWAHSNLDQPDRYDYNYDLNSVLEQYGNAEKSFVPVSVTERKNGEEFLIMGRETNRIDGKPYSAQCMFVWRKEKDNWKLLREYIELER
ncbi:nuclear transport factor 2 family protein [Psychrobacillus sp. FJAT-21963]|uniref:nuclear transport factor 2 family protein n=1 Tax=Psychrobacillus sp. FJAT-21963 TaxID=1712028 RepID=UPI0006FE817A|nr:nuclear transport factor 2 family protein [Psychrobacillus sp. FJAT-21963]KQL34876.1 hypothetical protein AN959_10905 [Psychrobacillus sp. FJAT-21963]